MKIAKLVWLKQFAEKIESKHHVGRDEVYEVFSNKRDPFLKSSRVWKRLLSFGIRMTP